MSVGVEKVDSAEKNNGATKAKKKANYRDGSVKGKKAPRRPKGSTIEHQKGKPDWKKVRQDTEKIRQQRKAKHAKYTMSQEAKKIWEEVRVMDCDKTQRSHLVRQLFEKVSGSVGLVVKSHDMSRICETLYELGDAAIRQSMFDEIGHELLSLSRDKYARHFLLKVLMYGPSEHKSAIGQCFRGRVPLCTAHKFSGEVLETFYREHASAEQKQRLLMEFYGCEFFLLSTPALTLQQLIAQCPEKRLIYLTNLRSNLQFLIDKQVLYGVMAHRVLRDYLEQCAASERAEFVPLLRDNMLAMVHTEDGAWLACRCLWWAGVKDRKTIVKSFKTHMLQVCTDAHAYLAVIALLACVDDTVLVRKALLAELVQNLVAIAENEHGRKVVHFLLSPRDRHYFHPSFIALLAEGDRSEATRKDSELRERELLEAVAGDVMRVASLHCARWICDSRMCVLLTNMLTAQRDVSDAEPLRNCLTQLAQMAALPLADDHIVNNSAAYMQLKKLVRFDRERCAEAPLFSLLLLDALSSDQLSVWFSTNRTAFLLLLMLETEVAEIVTRVRDRFSVFRKTAVSCKGSELLKVKLKAIKT